MKAHCLPFSQIPHTTRLFTEFLSYSPSVQQFYPRSPYFSDWIKEESSRISYDPLRREQVAAILERQNKLWGASPKALANLDRLRNGAVALVTGQQVGLFGGPMFCIYKALTAVKLAEQATAAGIDTVPIFWLATYDHDLAEVNHISFPGPEGKLQTLTTSSHSAPGAPVSAVRLGDEILPVMEEAGRIFGEGEAANLLRECYRPGQTLGGAFARLYTKLFADSGVIVLDASDPELHRIAKPIYRAAIERSGELATALLERGKALEAAGYHQQVKVTPSSVLVFMLHHGVRTVLHRREHGDKEEFSIGGEDAAEKISQPELLERISAHPEQFSPNVLLRPIVEDYLLPTLAYTGGAAETAYFAQAAAVYEILAGRITPVIPRYSATIVEPKMQRLLDRYGIAVQDVFGGPEALRQKIASRSLPEDLQGAIEIARKSLDASISAIKEKLALLDATLVDATETARSKMQHHLDKIHAQAARAESQKSELLARHAEILSNVLYPEKGLQEREIGAMYFVARYGRELLPQLYEVMQPECHDHQIVEL